EFADPPESREHSIAHRPGVAAGGKMVDGDPCGIRHLPGYERVSRDCGSNGAAVAAVEEPQRSEHAVGSLDAGGWIPRFANHHGHDVCNRTALPSGHGAELVVVGAAESVVDDGDDADIPGNQRNARAPASAAEYGAGWHGEPVCKLPHWVCVPDLERKLAPSFRHDRSAPSSAERVRGRRVVHVCEG